MRFSGYSVCGASAGAPAHGYSVAPLALTPKTANPAIAAAATLNAATTSQRPPARRARRAARGAPTLQRGPFVQSKPVSLIWGRRPESEKVALFASEPAPNRQPPIEGSDLYERARRQP